MTSIGNAVVTAAYKQTGKTVNARINVTFGSTTTFGAGQIAFSLPVTASSASAGHYIGHCYIEDAGVQGYAGFLQCSTTTVGYLISPSTNAAYAGNTAASNIVPFTWGNGDFFSGFFTYEAA